MKVSASGEAMRKVVIETEIRPSSGNAQRIRDEAARLKQMQDRVNQDRARSDQQASEQQSKQRQRYLTQEEELSAKYHLARMSRERQYATEASRTAKRLQQEDSAKESETARYHLARMRRESQYATERSRLAREEQLRLQAAEREQMRMGAALARQYDRQIAERQRAEQNAARQAAQRAREAEREQLRAGAAMAREYDRRIADQERTSRAAARQSTRASQLADRDQMRSGSIMAREYDQRIAVQERTRREFRRAAEVRHNTGPRLGVAGIGQDAVGVLRGVGHIGVASGLFGENTEDMLEGLLAVEGGFNIARYGAPLINNLNRMRGFRRPVMGAARALSGSLGMRGLGILGTGLGTSAGAVALSGAAAIGGTAAAGYAGFDMGRNIARHGFMGGATPGSYTDVVSRAEVGAFDSTAGFFGFDPFGTRHVDKRQAGLNARRASMAEMEANRQAEKDRQNDLDRIAGVARDSQLGHRMATNANLGMSERSTLMVNRTAVRQEINGLGSSDTDMERGVTLRQTELQLIRQQHELERQMAREKLASLAQANSMRQQEMQASKTALQGAQQSIGSLDPAARSRLGSLIKRFQQSKSIDGFAAEDISTLQTLGGRQIADRIAEQQRAKGEAFANEHGVDIGQREAANDAARLAQSRRKLAAGSNLFGKTDRKSLEEPTRMDFNFSINVTNDAQMRTELQKAFDEIERLKRQQSARDAAGRAAG